MRFYSLVNPMASCWTRSVYLTTLLLRRLSPQSITIIMHILSPEMDKCPSWISRRERVTVDKHTSWSSSMKECCQPGRCSTGNLLIICQKCIQLSHRLALFSYDMSPWTESFLSADPGVCCTYLGLCYDMIKFCTGELKNSTNLCQNALMKRDLL